MCFGFGLAALLFGGCASYDRCVRKYGRVQEDRRIPVELKVEKESQFTSLPLSQIPLLLPGEVHIVESEESRASIRYWRDKYNDVINIEAECDTITLRDTIRVPAPTILDPPPPGKIARAWRGYANVAAVLLLLIILFVAIQFLKDLKL